MADNEFLLYPRERERLVTVGDQDLLFATAQRVCGIHLTNNDAESDAALEFRSAPQGEDSGELYFMHVVPKMGQPGCSQYVPIQFYAEGGLSVVLGLATSCDVTVFWVDRARAPRG